MSFTQMAIELRRERDKKDLELVAFTVNHELSELSGNDKAKVVAMIVSNLLPTIRTNHDEYRKQRAEMRKIFEELDGE